jgi:hypothetical protein
VRFCSIAAAVVSALFVDNCTIAEQDLGARNSMIEPAVFIQIPGPNPIMTVGESGAWDDQLVEVDSIYEERGTYYLNFHANGAAASRVQVGVATSQSPLGPFVKHPSNPVLTPGASGSWDDAGVFCSHIIRVNKLDNDQNTRVKYFLIYAGSSSTAASASRDIVCDVGLATADSPLGPWTKLSQNPVLKDFGYPGGIAQKDGKWYLFSAYPVNSTGARDYSPFSVATADKLEGPWTKYSGNPVVPKGGWGEWDDGGYSEADVFVDGGVFHMFYGGGKPAIPGLLSRESIGYAYSFDGFHWTKYTRNPVAVREAEPGASALAEVHALFKPPFVYCYHSLRFSRPQPGREKLFPCAQNLGVQVLAVQRPFSLEFPVISRRQIEAGKQTTLVDGDSHCVPLGNVSSASITVECKFNSEAKTGLRIHMRSSPDGERFDTEDLAVQEVEPKPGKLVRQSFALPTAIRFLKVIIENLDTSMPVTDIALSATLRG